MIFSFCIKLDKNYKPAKDRKKGFTMHLLNNKSAGELFIDN